MLMDGVYTIIEMVDDDIIGARSYDDMAEAEEVFKQIAIENEATEEEAEEFLEGGYYESGNYQLWIHR